MLQQYQLRIENAALVKSDPQLQRLVDQIWGLTPTLFTPQRKLTLQVDRMAPLTLPDQETGKQICDRLNGLVAQQISHTNNKLKTKNDNRIK